MLSGGGARVGRIAGVAVYVDWSLVVVFSLIPFELGTGIVPAWHPDWSPAVVWATALGAAVAFFASVLAHELSHALVGRANGISVRKISLFMFGGLAQVEGEPPSWRAEFAMALVGPLTSLALGVGFLALATATGGPLTLEAPAETLQRLGPLATLLLWLGPVNVTLGLFNLVPGFPLDGGRVLRAGIWAATGNLRQATRIASRVGQGFAWTLLGTGVAMALGVHVPVFGGGFLGGLWVIFIGWFLNKSATFSYRQLILHESLRGLPVAGIMQSQLVHVPPEMPVTTLVDELVMSTCRQRAFPVEDGGRFVGLLVLRDLYESGRTDSEWERTSVADVMIPAERLATVRPRVPPRICSTSSRGAMSTRSRSSTRAGWSAWFAARTCSDG